MFTCKFYRQLYLMCINNTVNFEISTINSAIKFNPLLSLYPFFQIAENLISPSNADLVLELLKDLGRQLKESPDVIPVIDNSLINTSSPGPHRMKVRHSSLTRQSKRHHKCHKRHHSKDESTSASAVCDLTTSSCGSLASNPELETGKPVEEPSPEETPPAPPVVEKESKPVSVKESFIKKEKKIKGPYKKDESTSASAVCDLTTSSCGSLASNPELETGKPVEEPSPEETPPAPPVVEKENKPDVRKEIV
ncbi:uncharacterized protein LOC103520395 [Diaphorina citri]|uniref:Uncharacterized protein LOC103520395 n=1 Tax=Diaphorina citri TaxID=121845 RepID=A0A3Q0JFS6_DIACI|nr:uncharacterized protein LOC103520395 [Diaphorina citri]